MDAGLSGADKTTVSRTTQPISCGLPSNDLTKSLRCCSKTGGRIQEKLFDWLAKTGTALQQTLLPSELCALFIKSGIKQANALQEVECLLNILLSEAASSSTRPREGSLGHSHQTLVLVFDSNRFPKTDVMGHSLR